MSANEQTTTRGGALKRLLLVAGGAVGVGVAGDRLLSDTHDTAAPSAPSRREQTTLVLEGRNWRHASPSTQPGQLPGPTDIAVPVGTFVDREGKELGTFRAASLTTLAGAIELHTFDLSDGTILGIGSAGIHDKPFAIVGGTGRYAGASGTYVARQSPRELGGDGTAEFTLTLASRR